MTDPTGRHSVLLVDSDDDTRELYVHAFATAQWIPDGAESGAIALAKALERVPSLVVTELRLTGIDGFELIRILRRDPDTSGVSIIVVSGDALPSSAERARAAGADLVLPKPCLPDELVAQATGLVESVRAVAAASGAEPARAIAKPPKHQPFCPACGAPLAYTHAHATRVGRRSEQWLHFMCPQGCGRFEYRERTKKLRQIS